MLTASRFNVLSGFVALVFSVTAGSANSATIFVDGSVAASGDGTTWGAAKKTIDEALTGAVGGDQVWVRRGTYVQASSIVPADNIGIYGGFSGTEATPGERVISSNPTIVRRVGGATFPIVILNASTGVTLDGLVLTGGTSATGGGVCIVNSGATNLINKCTISGNSATVGGGVYLSASSPTITNSTISGNVATGGGGGLYAESSSAAVLTNCILSGNRAATGGGAHCQTSSPTFLNCTLSANSSNANGGGGIYALGGAAPLVKNCLITYNGSYGIAEGDVASAPICISNDLYKNVSRSYLRDGSIVLKNANKLNQLPGNAGNIQNGAPAYVMEGPLRIGGNFTAAGTWSAADQTTTLTIGAALFTPGALVGRTIALGTGRGPHRQALILSNTTNRIIVEDLNGTLASLATNNSAFAIADYHLQSSSGAINKGTNSGAPATDIDGDARPQGPSVDVGVDEFVVLPVNQPPVNTVPGTQNMNEDTNRIFSTGNGNAISIADPDAGVNPVRVTLTTANAVLTLSTTASLSFVVGDGFQDTTMTFAGTITDINTALNGLIFRPNQNFNGSTSLAITTNDQGNSGSGGPLSDTDSITINVTALNDAPVNTVPAAQETPEGFALIFSLATGNAISVADVDAGTNQLSATLTALHGDLTLASLGGLTLSQGSGTNDTVVSFQGSLLSINAALQGMTFQPEASYNGAAGLTITINDNGFTGVGGPLTDSDAVAITINPITNVPQLANVALTQNLSEGDTATVSGQIADLDNSETYTLTINWGDGSALQQVDLAAGATIFSTNHAYPDDNPSGTASDVYTVSVDIIDAGSQTDSASVPTTVFNVAPVIATFDVTPTLDEGTTATAHVTFTDIGILDTHTVTIDWGDGLQDVFNLAVGDLVVTATHQYIDDGISGTPADDYGVQVTVEDDDLGSDVAVTTTTVANVDPQLVNVFMPLVAAVDANTTLTANIIDPGSADSFDVTIDWDDGTTDEIPLDPGTTEFSIVNSWASQGTYVATITIVDDDGGTTFVTRTIIIDNNLMVMQNVAATSPVNEGGNVTLTGDIGDSNPDATFNLTVNWGDGAPQIIPLPAGSNNFSVQHLYQDDNPTATPFDPKSISVQLVDSDARTVNDTANTTVQNVAPQLSGVAFAANVGQGETATLNGTITDPGVLDTFSLAINWGDGSSTETVGLPAGSLSFSRTHQYNNLGDFQAIVVLTDDDTGSGQAQAPISVGGTVGIANLSITDPINEGESGNLTADISSSTPAATFSLQVNWGDGGTTQTIPLGAGTTSFDVPHLFVDDNPTATSSDPATVTVRLVDSGSNVAQTQISTTIQNVAPQLSGVAFTGTISQGQTATLNGTITDPGTQDTFSLDVDWGDGSGVETVALSAGATSFSRNHQYSTMGGYQANVTLTDDDTGSDGAQANLTVTGVVAVSNFLITDPVDEGSLATLSGDIASPNPLATMTLQVGWGDGSSTQSIPLAAGSTSFSVQHLYSDDNPTATASDIKPVSILITDSDLNSNQAQTQVTVNNVAPQLNSVAFAAGIQENGTATLNGNIVDPGVLDTFTLLVNWGDGTTTQSFPLIAGSTSFSQTHQYLQSGNFQANVVLTDDDTGSANANANLAVANVAPTLTSLVATGPVNIGQSTGLSANIVDPGTLDSFQVTVDWGDGSGNEVINRPAGSTSFSANHTYASPGTYPIGVTVTDSNGGSNNYNTSAVVNALADIAVSKLSPANTQPGGTLIYTITVTNNGPNTAHNAFLDDLLPGSVTFTTATTTLGTVSFGAGNVHVEFGDITLAQSATVTVFTTVSGSASGTISNTATAAADELDANATNDSSTANSTVVAPPVNADLQLDVSAPAAGAQGLPLTYTMLIFNAGPVAATNVVLTDLLPNTVEFISATPDANTTITGGLFEGGVVTATFPSIGPSSGASVTVTVRPFVTGALSNSATVSGDQFDPNLANNTDSADSTIAARSAADFRGQYIKLPIAKCKVKNGISKCSVKGQLAVTNAGLVTTQTIVATTLLSNDGIPDASDIVLRQTLIKTIKLGKTKKLKVSSKLPFNTSSSGKFVLIRLDSLDQVPNEIRERNNLIQFGPFQ